jgi:hypothetical protein
MNKKPSPPPALSRRDFLKLATAAGVTLTGAYGLGEFAPWLNYDQQSDRTRQPLPKALAQAPQLRDLVRQATLAANGHNTQPWKFAIQDQAIDIHPDYTRRLPAVDPQDRELWISLGCALENLLLAARAAGYAPEVTYPEAADVIHIGLTPDAPQPSAQYAAIPLRQNTRSEYNGQSLPNAELDQLQALPLEPGVTLKFVLSSAEIETALAYVNEGNLKQYADQAFVDELIHWLRFNKREALVALDGLYSRCSGNPEVPGWLGRLFVASTQPQQQAEADAKKLRSSSGAVVIAADADNRVAWVRTGQVYERLALTLTALKIKSAFLNQPIELAAVRSEFQTALGLGASLPQLLVRFGYASPMPSSLRRPVEQVLL